jgi:hypothetical protein
LALAGLWGYYVGALRLLGYLGSLAAAYGCGPTVGSWIAPVIMRQFGTSAGTTRWLALAAGGGLVLLLVQLFVRVIARRWLSERPRLESANRLLGFAVGGVQGTAAMVALLGGILVAEPHARQRLAVGGPSHGNSLARAVSRRVTEIAAQTRRSSLGAYIVVWNPLENVKPLRSLQRAATVVNDPEKLRTMVRSSGNEPLRQMMESLSRDPQIRNLTQSGQPLDENTIGTLLQNPAVARLLENLE